MDGIETAMLPLTIHEHEGGFSMVLAPDLTPRYVLSGAGLPLWIDAEDPSEAPGAVNRHGWRLSRHWTGVGGRLWEQAINRVFLQPLRLLPRTHRPGDKRDTGQEDEPHDRTGGQERRQDIVPARMQMCVSQGGDPAARR